MKANELMIGDWVMVYPWDETPWMPKKITDINFHSWEGADFCDSVGVEGWDELLLDQIKPIPLTPEILEKNGFEYFHKNYSSLSYNHPFKLKMTNWSDENGLGGLWTISNIIEIRFVHQLQHALRLCGIEKEIEL